MSQEWKIGRRPVVKGLALGAAVLLTGCRPESAPKEAPEIAAVRKLLRQEYNLSKAKGITVQKVLPVEMGNASEYKRVLFSHTASGILIVRLANVSVLHRDAIGSLNKEGTIVGSMQMASLDMHTHKLKQIEVGLNLNEKNEPVISARARETTDQLPEAYINSLNGINLLNLLDDYDQHSDGGVIAIPNKDHEIQQMGRESLGSAVDNNFMQIQAKNFETEGFVQTAANDAYPFLQLVTQLERVQTFQ